ncbi:MAG: DUF1080 domain-containing protein [Isosphaeraceae bacterium]|nr:DUF1080 domain-containing protein [Isosphaeraceae bacterium]
MMPRSALRWTIVGLVLVASVSAVAHPGPPAGAEQSGDFIALFDGKSLNGWVTLNGQPPSRGWDVDDGAIHHRKGRGGHLISEQQFADFELRFEWKIAKGGNSGVKYRMTRTTKGLYGCEYQLLDDPNHINGKNPQTRLGSLYDLYAPDERAKAVKPVGEYNQSRIVAWGTKLEHWLNGKKILDVDTASDDWKDRISRSKFRWIDDFAADKPSPILLQDHGDDVWFRNIEIRRLPARRESK